MAYTIVSRFGQGLYDRLAPWQPATDDLAKFCDVIGGMFDEVRDLVYEQGDDTGGAFVPGYGTLYDPDLCPLKWLPYLGQFVGVPVPDGMSLTDARALVKGEAAIKRGTVGSIIAAVQPTLTGTQTVYVIERVGNDPYAISVVSGTAETPSLAASLAAALTMKPAGLILTYLVSDYPLVSQYSRLFSAITAQLATANLADVT